jgi:hypothetical protein
MVDVDLIGCGRVQPASQARISQGDDALYGSWQKDSIGSWNLNPEDLFLVGNFDGGELPWQDLFVRNAPPRRLLRSGNSTLRCQLYG